MDLALPTARPNLTLVEVPCPLHHGVLDIVVTAPAILVVLSRACIMSAMASGVYGCVRPEVGVDPP